MDREVTGAQATDSRGGPAVQKIRELSFEDYYRNHRDRMFRALALTLGDVDLAADAADEAMVRTYQHWRKVRDYGNPTGWTYRVGLNWARSRLRKAKREQLGIVPETARLDPEGSDPVLVAKVAELPLPARSVVVMRFYLQWSHEEIAEALDIPIGTVKSRLHRAVADLRGKLEVAE